MKASLRVALRALGANKLRTSLTMLGIIIGVAAVIALMSIGRGAQAQVTQQISQIDVKARTSKDIQAAIDQVTAIMTARQY